MRIRTFPTVSVIVALALGLVGATAGISVHAAEEKAKPVKPRPAEPKGPKGIFELDSFGPRSTDNVALKWSEQTLRLIREAKPAPTVVSRMLAVVQTSVYDAWAAYDPIAAPTQRGGPARQVATERSLDNKSLAISYAAYRSLLDLFPNQRGLTGQFMDELYGADRAVVDASAPARVGVQAADAVLAARHADGSNQLNDLGGTTPYADYTAYRPANTPDRLTDQWRWQPLRLPNGAVQSFATPQWGRVRPFALRAPGQFPVPGPDLRKDYRKAVQDVVKFSAKLTDTDKAIAEYWSDGPSTELPPGHGAIFAGALCRAAGNNLDHDVKMLFLQANAVLDAGIAVWHVKRQHDFVRPITLVRAVHRGQKIKAWGGPGKGTVQMLGENWMPYQEPSFVTPPFAEYVSGHSAFTGATFQVLRQFTGTDRLNLSVTVKQGSSRIEPGSTPAGDVRLAWKSMQDAADQAGLSRKFGGIHFREGDLHGRDLGVKIGQAVFAKAQGYFNGTA
ncbi:MAG TPA: vanadium-dependent haloperoxidase [Catenuloplanes sp.]|jgi:hypothetical protein